MPSTVENQIAEVEERLRLAMLNSDVSVLDELISPELLFTTHLGQVVGKQDDLDAHRTGTMRLYELEPSEKTVRVHGTFAVVSVRMQASGTFQGEAFSQALRYTRVWNAEGPGIWRIVAGHMSSIHER